MKAWLQLENTNAEFKSWTKQKPEKKPCPPLSPEGTLLALPRQRNWQGLYSCYWQEYELGAGVGISEPQETSGKALIREKQFLRWKDKSLLGKRSCICCEVCDLPLGSGLPDAEACHVPSQGPRGKCWVWQLFHENWLSGLEEPMGERRAQLAQLAQLLFLKDALNAIYSL